jgi:hypothetical protein
VATSDVVNDGMSKAVTAGAGVVKEAAGKLLRLLERPEGYLGKVAFS